MTTRKKPRRDLVSLWQRKVARVLAQAPTSDLQLLTNLTWHKRMTAEQKYLVLETAIFEVWSDRMDERETLTRGIRNDRPRMTRR